jgi:hypothetical protein
MALRVRELLHGNVSGNAARSGYAEPAMNYVWDLRTNLRRDLRSIVSSVGIRGNELGLWVRDVPFDRPHPASAPGIRDWGSRIGDYGWGIEVIYLVIDHTQRQHQGLGTGG